MEEVFKAVGPFGLYGAIAMCVAAVLAHLFAIQLSNNREEMRKLRVALEKDPSPGQIAQALRLWPEATKYSGAMQLGELRKSASDEELRRAAKNEQVKGMVRVFFFLAALGIIIYVAGIFFGRPGREA